MSSFLSRYTCLCACLAIALSGIGCVTRTLIVHTNPPGAQVYVDDELIGESPAKLEFTYYGTRKIVVEKRDKDGRLVYDRETIYAKIGKPYYQWFPLDFAAEILIPMDIKDDHVLSIELKKKKFVPMAETKERLVKEAKELRIRAFSTEVH